MVFVSQLGQSFASFPESFSDSLRGQLSWAGRNRCEQGPPKSRFCPFYGDKNNFIPVLQSSPRLLRLFPVACGHARIESNETSAIFCRSPGPEPGRGWGRDREEPSLGQSRLKEAEIKTKLVKKNKYIFPRVLFSAILSFFLSRLCINSRY